MPSFEPLQHYLYFIFDPWNWGTNASEQLLAFGLIVLVGGLFKRYVFPRIWPSIHTRLRNWMKEVHHEAIEEHERWRANKEGSHGQ